MAVQAPTGWAQLEAGPRRRRPDGRSWLQSRPQTVDLEGEMGMERGEGGGEGGAPVAPGGGRLGLGGLPSCLLGFRTPAACRPLPGLSLYLTNPVRYEGLRL